MLICEKVKSTKGKGENKRLFNLRERDRKKPLYESLWGLKRGWGQLRRKRQKGGGGMSNLGYGQEWGLLSREIKAGNRNVK